MKEPFLFKLPLIVMFIRATGKKQDYSSKPASSLLRDRKSCEWMNIGDTVELNDHSPGSPGRYKPQAGQDSSVSQRFGLLK